MDELVSRLSQGEHPISLGGPQPSREELQKRLNDMGYVFIKFTGTRGGTDLGVRVDKSATDISKANFEKAEGEVHIEGTLILNYVKVRCIVELSLATLTGSGHLKVLEELKL